MELFNFNFLVYFNIDDFLDNIISVKVLILLLNGNVMIRIFNDKVIICFIKNLVFKRWKVVVNVFIVYEVMCEDLLIVLNRVVDKEFKDYCKFDIILKGRDIDEFVVFLNKYVVKEIEVNLLLWNVCICGLCGIDVEDDKDLINIIVLVIVIVVCYCV